MSTTPPEGMAALCSNCQAEHACSPSAWFDHIHRLFTLAAAGYPFSKKDLSTDEWFAIAEMKTAHEELMFNAK